MISKQLAALALAAATLANAAQAEPLQAFLTSSTGTGNLASWPDAGGATGLAAADAICRAHAQRAGLPQAADFIAWVSTQADGAYCRVRGLTGSRGSNCGVTGALPTAGPWVRTDGLPFLAPIDRAIDQAIVYRAAELDETGASVIDPALTAHFTGTGPGGYNALDTCFDWTTGSPDEGTIGGWPNRTGGDWSGDQRIAWCDQPARLLCLQRGQGDAVQPRQFGRIAFAAAAIGNGDLSTWPGANGATGLAAGDAVCRSEAQANGLAFAERFRAWLSDADTDARDRFTFDGPWVRLDGVRVADNLADLTDGSLQTSISLQADGIYLVGLAPFTGTLASGQVGESHCLGWTSSAPDQVGIRGRQNAVQEHWTRHLFFGAAGAPCNFSGRLYCLSDSDELFADNNEFPPY
jgi:hypothetical protein